MIPAQTLDEVLDQLNDVVQESKASNSRMGLFAYVYYRTTLQIRQAIRDGAFEDGERMERFDVAFANFYLQAYRDYQAQRPVSQAWRMAFDATPHGLAVLQHILLGMNAHINLDLGVAAHTVMRGQPIDHIKTDFMRVNDILASLVKELQGGLGRVSPLLFLLDWIGGRRDENVINFSMATARQFAWQLACTLSSLPPDAQANHIHMADGRVGRIAQRIIEPPGRILAWGLRLIVYFEKQDVRLAIEGLEIAEYTGQ
jgi:hypothetical protein